MLMKVRIRFRFFIILLSVSGIIAYIYFNLTSNDVTGYVFVERGEIILREQGEALIIRDEQVHELPKHGRAEFSVAEGDWLEEGEPLAELFSLEFDEQLLHELHEVQASIFAYQSENIVNYILDSDVLGLQSTINETIMDMQVYIREGEQSFLGSKERDLRRLLTERQEILDRIVVPDPYLKDLYEQEAEIKRQLGNAITEIKAPDSGIVSFSSDGLEGILYPEAVAYMTLDDIYALIRQEPTLFGRESEDRIPFVRLIDPNKWFVACIVTESNVFYNAGDDIELRFLENYERTFSGSIRKISRGIRASLIVIELTDDIQDVMSTRATMVEVGKRISGLMVPISSLLKQNDVYGVSVSHGISSLFAPVKVLAFGDKYAIIEDVEDATVVDINTRLMLE